MPYRQNCSRNPEVSISESTCFKVSSKLAVTVPSEFSSIGIVNLDGELGATTAFPLFQ